MLSKSRRIPRKDFKLVLNGKRYNSSHFLVYINKTKENPSQFSFSVSKKVSNKAVLRNKLRRQGYSVISKYIGALQGGFVVFFSFKKDKYPIKFQILEEEIVGVLKSNQILK